MCGCTLGGVLFLMGAGSGLVVATSLKNISFDRIWSEQAEAARPETQACSAFLTKQMDVDVCL